MKQSLYKIFQNPFSWLFLVLLALGATTYNVAVNSSSVLQGTSTNFFTANSNLLNQSVAAVAGGGNFSTNSNGSALIIGTITNLGLAANTFMSTGSGTNITTSGRTSSILSGTLNDESGSGVALFSTGNSQTNITVIGLTANGLTNNGAFKHTNGAVNGYVMTSDASGNGTWQAATGSQTPWTSDINAAQYSLTNVLNVNGGGTVTTAVKVNGVKVYRALLSQSGTNAPSATVLENTLGGTVVWTRASDGMYEATLLGAFTSAKTLQSPRSISYVAAATTYFIEFRRISSDVMDLIQYDGSEVAIDGLSDIPIEILVYP